MLLKDGCQPQQTTMLCGLQHTHTWSTNTGTLQLSFGKQLVCLYKLQTWDDLTDTAQAPQMWSRPSMEDMTASPPFLALVNPPFPPVPLQLAKPLGEECGCVVYNPGQNCWYSYSNHLDIFTTRIKFTLGSASDQFRCRSNFSTQSTLSLRLKSYTVWIWRSAIIIDDTLVFFSKKFISFFIPLSILRFLLE